MNLPHRDNLQKLLIISTGMLSGPILHEKNAFRRPATHHRFFGKAVSREAISKRAASTTATCAQAALLREVAGRQAGPSKLEDGTSNAKFLSRLIKSFVDELKIP
jgi:hypothetical protein